MNRAILPKPLKGIVPPVVTPLVDSETLDQPGFERLITHLISGGVQGLFVLGSTGEAPGLHAELRRLVVEQACALAAGRVPVLVGVSDTCFRDSVALAEHAWQAGASAVVLCPPYYFPLDRRELFDYFRRFAENVGLPVFLYNIPKFARTEIAPELVQCLAAISNVAGLKDSSGDLEYLRSVRQFTADRPDFSLFVGREEMIVAAVQAGANGAVCGGANLFPELHVRLYQAALDGRHAEARSLQELVVRIGNAVYTIGPETSSYLRGLKCGLSLLQICDDVMAEPLRAFSAAQKAQLRSSIDDLLPLVAKGAQL